MGDSDQRCAPKGELAPAARLTPCRARPDHRRILSSLVVVLAVGAATLAIAGNGPRQQAVASQAEVHGALDATLARRTVEMSFGATVHTGETAAKLGGVGAADFSAKSATYHVRGTVRGLPQTATIVFAGGWLYLDVAEVSRLIPGKSWVAIDDRAAERTGMWSSAGALAEVVDPATVLPLLARARAHADGLESTVVDGETFQRASVTLRRRAIAAAAADVGLPPSIATHVDTLHATVYVSGGMLRGVDLTVDGALRVTAWMHFHGYGQPVPVDAPPATSVVTFQQFCGSAPAALTSPGSLV